MRVAKPADRKGVFSNKCCLWQGHFLVGEKETRKKCTNADKGPSLEVTLCPVVLSCREKDPLVLKQVG